MAHPLKMTVRGSHVDDIREPSENEGEKRRGVSTGYVQWYNIPHQHQAEWRSQSQSQRTDEGETSGEETIESRVARIKARVAELTGNMDGQPSNYSAGSMR